VAIPGATNAALTITNVQVTNSGDYAVTLCNDYGCSTSTNAFLYLFDVYAWGAGQSNTVVSPNYGQSKVPFNLFAVTAVAGGGYHSLALRNNGRVTAWGDNNYGETNVPATLTNAVAIAAGLYHSVALRSNGTVTAWGFSGYGQTTVPAAATNVGAIAAGWDHTLALRTNGTVLAWGAGTSRNLWPNLGQCLVPTNLTGVSAIAAGGYHSLALRTNGTVVAWGWNAFGQTNVPAGLTNVVAIAAGGSNSIALKNDGTLVVWGANESGQTNIPTGLSNVVAIAAGAAHDLALKNDGTLVAWGLNANAQTNLPAGVANVTAISAGAYHTLALINVGPISFLSPPVGQTIFQGSNATFTVACLGSAPLAYQWRLNGTNLSGATNSSFTVSNAPLSAAGNYQVVVSNAFGVVASAIAVLMVSDVAPFFTAPPASTFVFQNSNVTLTASAGGLPPFNYQWLFNGAAIGGETSLSLTISNAQPANQGSYVVVASNAFGIANSAATFLDVVDVPQALGATNLTWFNPGLPVWFAEATNTHDGFAAAASGKLAYGQQNQLQTFVTGPGELTFWWSGQQNVTMGFQIDGVQQISQGFYYASTWNQLTYYLPSKVHLLTWTAANQFSLFYTNLGFLDQVVFTPGTTPVSITGQPGNQTVAAGNNVTFSVVAIGTPPFGYQWYFNGSPLPDATSSSLTLNNVQASAGGTYNVSVITGNNTLVSSNAVLTISPSAPVITSQPVGGPTMTGGTFAFSSGAIGSSPIAYQWLWNGLPITGGTNATFNLNNIQYAAAGNYSLLASNTVGTAVSSNALLFVYSIGDLGTALDNPGLNWSTTNMPWFPQTNTTYDGVSAAQSGAISGSQQSTLQATVTGPAMVIYWWMVDCDGFWDSLTFSANDTVLSSITGSVGWQQTTNYIGSGTQVLQWKLYPVYGAFAGGTGWLDQVQVIPISGTDVVITAQSGNLTTSAGDNVTFSVTATGTPPLGYQWEFNGTNLPGANSSTLTLNNVQGANAGSYGVVVTNDFGFASSSNATLVVNPSGPVIISQPASQTNLVNSSAEFSVSVQGTPSFSYQWYFNGSAIAGANSSFLVVSNLKPANAGHYDVIVSNVLGSATSANASLSVVSSKVYEFWPYNHAGYTAPANSGSLTAIAVGASHTMALRTDGTVSVWGNNYYGQTNLPAGLSNVVAIAAGDTHCLALKADGTVVAWGGFGYGQGTVPAGLSNVVAIAAGPTYNVALKADGTVAGWGSDKYGETDIPAGLTNVQAIFAGYFNGFALTADGSLTQWGNDPVWQHDGTNTQLRLSGRATNVAGVAAGSFSGWSLQNDGSVLAYGWYDGVAPFTNSYGTGTTWNPGVQSRNTYNNIAAMAAYGNSSPFAEYALLLGTNGTITPVGGSGGQIGIAGSYVPYITTSPSSPFPTSPANVAAIAAGNAHAAALVTDGSPHISRPAISRVVFTGDTVVFSTSASGQAPLSYQWLFNNTKIDSATNAVLVLTNVPLSAAGNYCCAVSNSVGTVTGLQATLTVLRSTLRFDSVLPFSANGFSWQLDQLSGHGAIIIYVSTNLTDWVPILTNAPVTGSIEFLDSGATNEPARFYRAVEQ
jgi:alpha-tubulin suppressor-like RCC1 family protein